MKESTIMYSLAACGVAATAYGMIQKNNIVFIAGLVLGTAAYLLFRRRLNAAIKKREERKEESQNVKDNTGNG